MSHSLGHSDTMGRRAKMPITAEIELSELDDGPPELPPFEKFIRNSAISIYFAFNIDPYSIYKGTYKLSTSRRLKYQKYLRPELRMAPSKLDKWRPQMWLVSMSIYSFLLVRFTLICLVQVAKYQSTTYIDQMKPSVNDTELIKLLKYLNLFDLFGNILSDFPSTSISLYAIFLISMTYLVVYTPYSYMMIPIDCVNLRIGMNLPQERKRINLTTKETLKSLLQMQSTYHLQRLSTFMTKYDVENKMADFPLHHDQLQDRCDKQGRKIHQERLRGWRVICCTVDESLRSLRYTSAYYLATWSTVKTSYCIVVSSLLAFCFMMCIIALQWTTEAKCRMRDIQQNYCSYEVVLTKVDIFSIAELLFAILWVGTLMCTIIITVSVQLAAQLISINELKSDLKGILRTFRSIESDTQTGCISSSSNQTDEVRLCITLLKLLVKTSVSLAEFRNATDFLSTQVASILVFYGSFLLLSLTVGKMEGPDMGIFRANAMLFGWISSNLVLLACAYQYAKIIKLQQIGWSIVGQLNRRLPSNKLTQETILSRVSSGWRRLIESGTLIDVRNSIRPFGVSITFRQILEMNFYVTSLAALVTK